MPRLRQACPLMTQPHLSLCSEYRPRPSPCTCLAQSRVAAHRAGEQPHGCRHGPGAACGHESRWTSGGAQCLRQGSRVSESPSVRLDNRTGSYLGAPVLRQRLPRRCPEADGLSMRSASRTCWLCRSSLGFSLLRLEGQAWLWHNSCSNQGWEIWNAFADTVCVWHSCSSLSCLL